MPWAGSFHDPPQRPSPPPTQPQLTFAANLRPPAAARLCATCAAPCSSLVLFLALAPAAQAETLSYRFGPIHVSPGQNTIELAANDLKPPVDGWITSFKPNLTYENGVVPRVDVVHLHHGVWLSNFAPLFAAGEEKTILRDAGRLRLALPHERPVGHEPHDPQPHADAGRRLHRLRARVRARRDARGGRHAGGAARSGSTSAAARSTRCSTCHRGAGGRDGRYTFPDESRERNYTRHRVTIQQDGVLVGTGGHLHPGGLWTDLWLERGGRKVRLFRSRAKYFEPAGAVSWDVAMEVTPARVAGRRQGRRRAVGERDLRLQARLLVRGDGDHAGRLQRRAAAGPTRSRPTSTCGARSPTATSIENRNHGGAFGGLADPRKLLAGPVPRRRTVAINDFVYGAGDLLRTGMRRRPPAIRRGTSLKFVNRDADDGILHSITSCRAPCNRTTGHRLSARRRPGPVRLGQPRLRAGGHDRGGAARDVEDAEEPARRDLHLLLPRAPLHARLLPRPQALTDCAP